MSGKEGPNNGNANSNKRTLGSNPQWDARWQQHRVTPDLGGRGNIGERGSQGGRGPNGGRANLGTANYLSLVNKCKMLFKIPQIPTNNIITNAFQNTTSDVNKSWRTKWRIIHIYSSDVNNHVKNETWWMLGQLQTPNTRNHKKSKTLLLEQHFYLQWNKWLFVDWWTRSVQQLHSDPMIWWHNCNIVQNKRNNLWRRWTCLFSNEKHIFRWSFACFQINHQLPRLFVETQEWSSRSEFPSITPYW